MARAVLRFRQSLVFRVRLRTVAKTISIWFVVLMCFQCLAGKSWNTNNSSRSFTSFATAFLYFTPQVSTKRSKAALACPDLALGKAPVTFCVAHASRERIPAGPPGTRVRRCQWSVPAAPSATVSPHFFSPFSRSRQRHASYSSHQGRLQPRDRRKMTGPSGPRSFAF